MINDIRKLGFGNYGSVMLAEVENHPDIKMAVKVCWKGKFKSQRFLQERLISIVPKICNRVWI